MPSTPVPAPIKIDPFLAPADIAVALYCPVAPAAWDGIAVAKRFEQVLDRASTILKDRGENGRGARGTSALQHARETFAQVTADMRRSPAFAVFATQHEAQFMPLPQAAPELAAVGSHFYIKPILRMIDRRPHFYILAISAGKVRLYEADRYVWNDVTSRLPGGVQSVQAETDFEGGVQFSPVGRPNAGTTGGVVPGHSYESPAELHKAQVIEYLHRVASAVDEQLKNDPSPVVLAAEPEILGHFPEDESRFQARGGIHQRQSTRADRG
jgi:hypothetical protein